MGDRTARRKVSFLPPLFDVLLLLLLLSPERWSPTFAETVLSQPAAVAKMSPSADEFDRAAKFVKEMPEGEVKPNDDQKLSYYKYYKQATEGDCGEAAPGMLNFVAKAKHNAWVSVKGMAKDEAKLNYVKTLDSMVADWRDKATEKGF